MTPFTPDYTVLIAGDVYGFTQDDARLYLWVGANVPECPRCDQPLISHSKRHDNKAPVSYDSVMSTWAIECESCGWESEPAEAVQR